MKSKLFSDPAIKFFGVFTGLVILAIVLKELQHIFLPFTVAYFLFFLISPLNKILFKKKFPLWFVIPLDIIIFVLIFGLSGQFVWNSFMQFFQNIDIYFSRLDVIIRDFLIGLGVDKKTIREFSVASLIAGANIKAFAGDVFSSAVSLIGSIVLTLFFFAFIVGGHRGVFEAFRKRYTSEKKKEVLKEVEKRLSKIDEPQQEKEEILAHEKETVELQLSTTVKEITHQIQKYIISKIAINLSAGIVVTLALHLLKIDFPVVWGALTFFLNFIPSIGSAIALIFPTMIALTEHNSLSFAFMVAGVMAIIQTVFFNLLEPNIIGKRLDLNPIIILLSVLIWGYIWGIVGMLLAVPLTAIIKIIISNSDSQNLKFIVDLMDQDK